jgi:hypothetical protein
MTRRSGSADLPLHGGRVPSWLGERMTRLGAVISQAVVRHYGRDELLKRLAHPFWFQSFGAVMGMDWHSSGITTSVIGALKRGLKPLEAELGIYVCGGRGGHSRKTPAELLSIGERVGFDGAALAKASRLVAKVDSAAVQDGFELYLHGFIVTDDARWVVVQQGMKGEAKLARRYHWLSEGLQSFIDDPHAAIEGAGQGEIVNLADRRAAASRRAQLELLSELGPEAIGREFSALQGDPERTSPAKDGQMLLPHLVMPAHHEVRASDVMVRRRLRVYDETIRVLKPAVANARLGRDEELAALQRLDAQARALEREAEGPSVEAVIATEMAQSHALGGRSVFGWEPPPAWDRKTG